MNHSLLYLIDTYTLDFNTFILYTVNHVYKNKWPKSDKTKCFPYEFHVVIHFTNTHFFTIEKCLYLRFHYNVLYKHNEIHLEEEKNIRVFHVSIVNNCIKKR